MKIVKSLFKLNKILAIPTALIAIHLTFWGCVNVGTSEIAAEDSNKSQAKSLNLTDYPAVRIINFYGLHDGFVKTRPNLGRMATYWTIGSPLDSTVDGAAGMFGNPNIAIIAPLKYLMGQAVNLSCFDTMILGELDLRLLPKVTILVPKNTKLEIGDVSRLTLVEYDDATIQQAVKSFLRTHFPEYVLKFRAVGDRKNVALDREGHDLNLFQKFQPLLADHPHISFGWTSSSIGGFNPFVQAAMEIVHQIDYGNNKHNRYLVDGLAKVVPILTSSFQALEGKIDTKAIKAALDLSAMANSRLAPFKLESLTSDGFRKLPLEDRVEVVEGLALNTGDIDLQALYSCDHWAVPYIKIIDLIRKLHKSNIIGQFVGVQKFESSFDPELAAKMQDKSKAIFP